MFVLIGAAGVCLASALAMIYGGVIFLGAFISDDEAVANRIAAHGLIYVGIGLVGLLAVIIFAIRAFRQTRGDRRSDLRE